MSLKCYLHVHSTVVLSWQLHSASLCIADE